MKGHYTIEDRLEYTASKGSFKKQLNLWGAQVKMLTRDGFDLIPIGEIDKTVSNPYLISWEESSVNFDGADKDFINLPVDDLQKILVDSGIRLCYAEYLWLVATEAQRRISKDQ